jgi:hypothetical protein
LLQALDAELRQKEENVRQLAAMADNVALKVRICSCKRTLSD